MCCGSALIASSFHITKRRQFTAHGRDSGSQRWSKHEDSRCWVLWPIMSDGSQDYGTVLQAFISRPTRNWKRLVVPPRQTWTGQWRRIFTLWILGYTQTGVKPKTLKIGSVMETAMIRRNTPLKTMMLILQGQQCLGAAYTLILPRPWQQDCSCTWIPRRTWLIEVGV